LDQPEPLDDAHLNGDGGDLEGSTLDQPAPLDDAPLNTTQPLNHSSENSLAEDPIVKKGAWVWLWEWTDFLFVWIVCLGVYGFTFVSCMETNDPLSGEQDIHVGIALAVTQAVVVASCVQRSFIRTAEYETSTALAKRLVVLHVLTFAISMFASSAYCRFVFFEASWQRIHERMRVWNTLLAPQQQQDESPSGEWYRRMTWFLLARGVAKHEDDQMADPSSAHRSMIQHGSILVIQVALGYFDGLHPYPETAKTIVSFVCLASVFPRFYVGILIARFNISTAFEIQYNVLTALLVAVCWAQEVIIVSLVYRTYGLVCWLMEMTNKDTVGVTIPLSLAAFAVFAVTESRYIYHQYIVIWIWFFVTF
jgi:hypothetical protein